MIRADVHEIGVRFTDITNAGKRGKRCRVVDVRAACPSAFAEWWRHEEPRTLLRDSIDVDDATHHARAAGLCVEESSARGVDVRTSDALRLEGRELVGTIAHDHFEVHDPDDPDRRVLPPSSREREHARRVFKWASSRAAELEAMSLRSFVDTVEAMLNVDDGKERARTKKSRERATLRTIDLQWEAYLEARAREKYADQEADPCPF